MTDEELRLRWEQQRRRVQQVPDIRILQVEQGKRLASAFNAYKPWESGGNFGIHI